MANLCEMPIVAAVLVDLWSSTANAHHASAVWTYPLACCKGTEIGGDCQRVPDGHVTIGRHGYAVTLNPGDHALVTRKQMYFIPYGDEIPSGDAHFHICLHPTEDHVNCFFAPPEGF